MDFLQKATINLVMGIGLIILVALITLILAAPIASLCYVGYYMHYAITQGDSIDRIGVALIAMLIIFSVVKISNGENKGKE